MASLRWAVLSLLTLSAGSATAATTGGYDVSNAIKACGALFKAFPSQLFQPNTPGFTTESQAIWSETCLITPSCVFTPNTTADVSKAIKIISGAKSNFSIRAGGHMPIPGAQSVRPGVMIALSNLHQRTLSSDGKIASLGPGQVWMDVYKWLQPHGLAANGGRYPSVGVGGLLVGGGIGYFSSAQGWGCDSVVAYEVVLADGSVVTATAQGDHADLFWALRGGHNHFGVVTRYDMRTFPVGPAFGRQIAWNVTASPDAGVRFFKALDAYYAPGGGVDDPSVAIIPTVAIAPGLNLYEVITGQIAFGSNPAPKAFENFTATAIPGVTTLDDGNKVFDDWTWFPAQLNGTSARTTRNSFFAVSFKPDPRAISIANKTVIEEALKVLSPAAAVAFTFQPISKKWLQSSEAAGGNALGLCSKDDGTFVAGLLAAEWVDPADDAKMFAFSQKVISEIESQTKQLGLHIPFIYLNDAGPGQAPFTSYGAKNEARLKAIRRKYDPHGFLRDYLAHGFEL